MEKAKTIFRKTVNFFRSSNKIAIIAAGVVVIIAAAVWFGFKSSEPDAKVVAAARQISLLTDNVRKFYRNRPDAWGLNTQSVLKNAIAPQEMVQNGKLVNALGKETIVGANADGMTVMPGGRNFVIAFRDLTYEECVELAALAPDEKTALSLTSETIANATETMFVWGGEHPLPITRKAAEEFCKQQNSLIWNILL